MKLLRNFATMLAFFAAAIALAVVAAFLPSGGEQKKIQDLRIEYGIEPVPSIDSEEYDVLDFLKFQLNPVEVGPHIKIIRSRQPSNKKIVAIEKPTETQIFRSPPEFVIVVEDNSTEILEKLTAFIKQEQEIRYDAVKTGNLEDCDLIEQARARANCRGEIYFQKAILGKNISLCDEIEDEKSRTRCLNYVYLIPK